MNINYTFDQPETDAQNFYFYKEGFNADELNRIESSVSELPWHDAKTEGDDKKQRKSTTF